MSKHVNNFTRIADTLRPWVIRPFFAVIAVGLFSLGSSILVTDVFSLLEFFYCIINNTKLFGQGLEEKCTFPPIGELTDNSTAILIGVSFVVMAFFMGVLYIIVAHRTRVDEPPLKPKYTLLLPNEESCLHTIITSQLYGSKAEIKRSNISMEDYKQLVVLPGPQPGEFDTELALLQDLLTRLRPHELGDLSLSRDGENYRLTATSDEQREKARE